MLPSHRSKELLDPVAVAMVNHWRSYSGVRVRDSGCVLDVVNGIVFLMKETVQPLCNWNIHGRRRRLRIYILPNATSERC